MMIKEELREKYFGHLSIPENVIFNIISRLDNREIMLVLYKVSKTWNRLITDKNFQERLLKFIVKRLTLFKNKPVDNFELLISGYTNINYKLRQGDNCYVLRIPLMQRHILICRKEEQENTRIAFELGLGAQLMFYEPSTGNMITKFIENKKTLEKKDMFDKNILPLLCQAMKKMHNANKVFAKNWNIFLKINELFRFICSVLKYDFSLMDAFVKKLNEIEKVISKLNIPLFPCHNDLSPNNFLLLNEDVIKIIDFEFAGNNDIAWDLAFLVTVSELNENNEKQLLSTYFGKEPEKVLYYRFLLYKPLVHFWVGLLTLLQIYNCNKRLGKDWLLKIAKDKVNKASALLEQTLGNNILEQLKKTSEEVEKTCIVNRTENQPFNELTGDKDRAKANKL